MYKRQATVEGKRTIQDVINDMREEGIVNTGVFLAPLMLVAGDHANNDMAGDDESFATILKANGYTPQCLSLIHISYADTSNKIFRYSYTW